MQFGTTRTQFSHHSSSRYPNMPEKQDNDLKSHLMEMIDIFEEDTNNCIKEIQENTGKQLKELNKEIQDLKVEVETIKKTQMGHKPGNGKPRKAVRNYRCKHQPQNTRDRRENLRC